MVKKLKTNTIGGNVTYPRRAYDGQDNQSYGFIQPRQFASGATRGEQRISGRFVVVDDENRTRIVMGFDKGGF